jgi:hypothetical protein
MLCKFVSLVQRTTFSLMQPNYRSDITIGECFRPTANLIIREGRYLKKSLVNFC